MSTPDSEPLNRGYLGRSAKRLLIVSFGILLAFLIVAGWSAIAMLSNIHAQQQAASLDFLARAEPLTQIHSNLTVYGELASASPDNTSQLYSQIRAELARYPQERRAYEQTLIDHLQQMLVNQDRVRLIAATEQITLWNDNNFRTANATLLTSFLQLQNRLKILLFFLLSSGLAIALGSIVLIAAQEKEIRGRYAELSESNDARAQLSARLMNAQEQERLSISRELHDEVGQSLGALLVDIGRLSANLPAGDQVAQEQIRKMRLLTEASVSAVRNIALLLRPSMLDDLGLVAAMEWQAREISRRSNVEVEVQAEELTHDLPEALKICIYRVTQEALNNVARHSGAHQAFVTLRTTADNKLEVKIRDDGKGFDSQRSRGLGILGMEERIRLLHGSLSIEATPGSGTQVTALLPLV